MEKKGLKRMKNSSKSKKAIVYENLKNRILSNLLNPGEPLSEGILLKS